MLSLPVKDRAKSCTDLFSQMRTVEEATNCRDKIMFVCFSLFCNRASFQFQEIQYSSYTELAKQIFQGVLIRISGQGFQGNIKRDSVCKY